ncbi:MAG: hypothetical protein FWD61_10850, partial [Phycisphaerales bacterium]|nr:hypothetical protein [Phycisphaerales bacterium]
MSQSPDNFKAKLTLSEKDAAAVDALLDSELTTPTPDLRTQRIESWLKTLNAAQVPPPSPDLLARTLAAVQSDRMKLSSPPVTLSPCHPVIPSFFRRHLADIAAGLVAACILVAVTIPVVAHTRYTNRRILCAANVATIGTAFDQYAINAANHLPSLANTPGSNWLRPSSTTHTNTANLVPLALTSLNAPAYISLVHFLCPGRDPPSSRTPLYEHPVLSSTSNDIPDCDYSYTNLFSPYHPTWDGKSSTFILADKNPLFSADATINPDFNSINHNRHGNYLLHADRSVTWESTPNIGPAPANIWTINPPPPP